MNARHAAFEVIRPAASGQVGFTLIELLIAVAIVAVLAAVAVPMYGNQVFKTRRADGQALLLEVASREEQFYLDHKTYTTDMTDLGYSSDPASSENGFYRIDVAAGATGSIASSFIATATRNGPQVEDSACGDFTLDSLSRRHVVNYTGYDDDPEFSDPEPTNCW
jgi:type IV pilus assembly protein PilE